MVHRWFKNLTFRARLIIWLLLISLIPIIIIGALSATITLDTAKKTYENNLYNSLLETNTIFNSYRSKLVLNSIKLTFGKDISDNFSDGAIQDQYYLQKVIYESKILLDAYCLYYFSLSGDYYSPFDSSAITTELQARFDSYLLTLDSGATAFWDKPIIADDVNLIPYIRCIKDYHSDKVVGFLVININEQRIAEKTFNSFRQIDASTLADNITLIDESDTIISSWDKTLIGKNFTEVYRIAVPKASCVSQAPDKKELFVSLSDNLSPFRYISTVNYAKVADTAGSILLITGFFILLCMAISVTLAVIISKSIIKPISKLTKTIDEVDAGSLEVGFTPLYNDEIGRLGKSFIQMTQRLKQSIEYRDEIQKRYQQAEYKALSAQINPHFLYNTISTILFLIDSDKKEESIRLLMTLSSMFRISVNKDAGMITIREEVEHVRNYLEIQKMRYHDQFNYALSMDMNILDLYTVKIVFQPLVENAIYHGIRDTKVLGIIHIVGKREGNNVIFEIRDNGTKITQEQIDNINRYIQSDSPENSQYGIGIKNIHDRIRFHFGEEYGVALRKDGDFTVSRVVIKAVERRPDDI